MKGLMEKLSIFIEVRQLWHSVLLANLDLWFLIRGLKCCGAPQVLHRRLGKRGIIQSPIPSSLLSPLPPPEAPVYIWASLCSVSNHSGHKEKEAKMTEERPRGVRLAQGPSSGTHPSSSSVSSVLCGGPMEYALHTEVGAGDLPNGQSRAWFCTQESSYPPPPPCSRQRVDSWGSLPVAVALRKVPSLPSALPFPLAISALQTGLAHSPTLASVKQTWMC